MMYDEDYMRKVFPFVKEEYFHEPDERRVFKLVSKFITKYNNKPSAEALLVDLYAEPLAQKEYETTESVIKGMQHAPGKIAEQWLLDETEKFCQDRAIYNAIMKSIQIIDGKDTLTKEALPDVLKEALMVSFDSNVGHDFIDDYEERYEFYHRIEEKVPFDIEQLNKITRGGVSKKTLNIILGGVGVGKTLSMCHFAASNLMQGKKVLYITLEMAEEKIAERIDANLMNVMLNDLEQLPKDVYKARIDKIKSKTPGQLIIKQFPTASVHVGHLRHLLNELRLKKNFDPDIIYVDYLNLCLSARLKQGGSINSYSYIKSVAEELRGLAIERNVPIMSATQVTRTGYGASDLELTDTAESFGLPATADLMLAFISTEELRDLNQYMVKQLKNRYSDVYMDQKFMVGVDKARMRLFEVDQSEGSDTPVMDNTKFGQRQKEDDQMQWKTKKAGRKDFSGLKT